MTQIACKKTVLVMGYKTCPQTNNKIQSNDHILVVSELEIPSLTTTLMRFSDFNSESNNELQCFLNDIAVSDNNTESGIADLFFELKIPDAELRAFAKNLSANGVQRLGSAISEKWMPYGVDHLLFTPLNTPIYS